MDISRDLANKTLAQDKSKLEGLMDTSGTQDVQASATEAGASPSLVSATADPSALRKVEAMRDEVKLAVADSYNNLGAIAATNNSYSTAVSYFQRASIWNPSLEGLDYNLGRAAFRRLSICGRSCAAIALSQRAPGRPRSPQRPGP